MKTKTAAEKLLEMFESQAFADFYAPNGLFERYITVEHPEGHPEHISREQILVAVQHFVKKHNIQ